MKKQPTETINRTELVLALIKEELKSQKFFSILNQAGIEDCYYQPNLSKLILSLLDMDDGKDETLEFYWEIISKAIEKVGANDESVTRQVLNIYASLTTQGSL